jgi:LPS export ABC transporter permease LptG
MRSKSRSANTDTVIEEPRETTEDEPGIARTFIFPSRLDVYLIKSFVSIYFMVQASLLMMLLLLEYTQIARAAQRNGVDSDVVFRYLLYKIPEVLGLSMFICLLIAVLIQFAIMSKNSEVTVIRAGGGSLQRLCLPLVFVGLLASLFSFYMENQFMPQSNRLALAMRNKIMNNQDALFARDVWLKRPSGEILNYTIYDQRERALKGVRLYRLPIGEGANPNRLEYFNLPSLAYNGSWAADQPGSSWSVDLSGEDPGMRPRAVEEGETFDLNLNMDDLSQRKRRASEFSIAELRDYVRYLQELGYDETHYRTEFYAKFAKPFLPLIMMLLAMPLGFQFGRRGTFFGVGTGLIVGLAFFGLFELALSLGSSGILAPVAAAWSAVTLFGFLALYRFIILE